MTNFYPDPTQSGFLPAINKPALFNHFLVRVEHLNPEGNLFGGYLMSEIDTICYCLLRRDLPGRAFVTRVAEINFLSPATLGDIIFFSAIIDKIGNTSVTVELTGIVGKTTITKAKVIFVRIENGKPTAVME